MDIVDLGGNMLNILVIDDIQDNLIAISALLKNLLPEISVITSQSGADGISIAIEHQPDVILLDIKTQYEDTVFNILSKTEHIKTWKSKEMPERFHYGKNNRTMDFVVVADSAWTLNQDNRIYKGKGNRLC